MLALPARGTGKQVYDCYSVSKVVHVWGLMIDIYRI